MRNLTNPFKGISKNPYQLIAAGDGPRNVELPDGTITSAAEIKRELEYPQLFAWNLEGKALLEWVAYLQEHPDCKSRLVVDSGAYSAWSRGKQFDMDEYINFMEDNKVLDVAFWAAEADVIPGSFGVDPTPEEVEAAPEKSWQNYLYMIERVSWPKKIVPIFHMGEDYKHLLRMLRYQFEDGDFIPYIGISPRNDVHVNEKVQWYNATWKIIYDECAKLGREIPLTHNFGCTTISIMEQFPSMSSDSTSWVRGASFGNIELVIGAKIKTVYVSNRNPHDPDHITNQSPAVKQAVEDMCHKIGHGITLQALLDDDKGNLRPLVNLYSLDEWRKSFVYKGTTSFKKSLW